MAADVAQDAAGNLNLATSEAVIVKAVDLAERSGRMVLNFMADRGDQLERHHEQLDLVGRLTEARSGGWSLSVFGQWG